MSPRQFLRSLLAASFGVWGAIGLLPGSVSAAGRQGWDPSRVHDVLVRVVHGPNDTPVVGAAATYVPGARSTEELRRLERLGKAAPRAIDATDDRGEVRLSLPSESGVFEVRHAGLYASTVRTKDSPSAPIVLRLAPAREAILRLTTREGRPIPNVTVQVRTELEGHELPSVRYLGSETTDTCGVVRFTRLPETLLGSRIARFRFNALMQFADVPPIVVDAARVAGTDEAFELPELGSVFVTLPASRPDMIARIQLDSENEGGWIGPTEVLGEGLARFDDVQVDRAIFLKLDGGTATIEAPLDREGEVRLALGPHEPFRVRYRGRLVDEAGAALPLHVLRPHDVDYAVTTDVEGRFEFEFLALPHSNEPAPVARFPPILFVRNAREPWSSDRLQFHGPAGVTWVLSLPHAAPGVHQVGDVVRLALHERSAPRTDSDEALFADVRLWASGWGPEENIVPILSQIVARASPELNTFIQRMDADLPHKRWGLLWSRCALDPEAALVFARVRGRANPLHIEAHEIPDEIHIEDEISWLVHTDLVQHAPTNRGLLQALAPMERFDLDIEPLEIGVGAPRVRNVSSVPVADRGDASSMHLLAQVEWPQAGSYRVRGRLRSNGNLVLWPELPEGVLAESRDLVVRVLPREIVVTRAELESSRRTLARVDTTRQALLIDRSVRADFRFESPCEPAEELLSLGWKALPALLEALERSEAAPVDRSHQFALLYDITGLDDPRDTPGVLGMHRVVTNGAGTWRERCEEIGFVDRTIAFDPAAQEVLRQRWLARRGHYEFVVRD